MATNKVCDVCNNPKNQPVHVVNVSIFIVEAVPGTDNTGVAHELEACERCWGKAFQKLGQAVQDQLLAHIPVHRKVYQLNDKIASLHQEHRRSELEYHEVKEDSAGARKLGATMRSIQEQVAQLEEERAELLRSVS